MAGHIVSSDTSDTYQTLELGHEDLLESAYDGLCEIDEAAIQVPVKSPAHDIANLLSVIVAICESLHEDVPEPRQAELARTGMLAAERAAELLDDLRDRPARAAAPRRPQVEAQRRIPAPCSSPEATPSVLVVDDDPRLLSLMSAAFTRAGFRTFSAKNGRVGLQILRAAKPDLLVTDIVMPEMEGLATIRAAKEASPGTRVVAISGGGQYQRHEAFLTWAEGLGADEVLAKPFKISSLLTAARVVLGRQADAGASARAV